MRKLHTMNYEMPEDLDILEAYIHKNVGYNKADFRKIKRSLRRMGGFHRNYSV